MSTVGRDNACSMHDYMVCFVKLTCIDEVKLPNTPALVVSATA